MAKMLKWRYDTTTLLELEKYRVSDNTLLKILVYGLTVSGAERAKITLRERKYTVETPYLLPFECVEMWLGYRDGKGPLTPLESNELGKIILAEVAKGTKIRIETPQYVAVIDGKGAAITDTTNSYINKTTIEIHKPNLSPWWDYIELNKRLREVKIPVTMEIHSGKEVKRKEFPLERKSGKVIWQSSGVTIEKFRDRSHGNIIINGISSPSPLPSNLVAIIEGQIDRTTVEGVEVRLPTIITPDCSDLKVLAIITNAKDEIEEAGLSKDWIGELTLLHESKLAHLRTTLNELSRAVKENPKFTHLAEKFVPQYSKMLETINILLREVTYYGYARERLISNNGR